MDSNKGRYSIEMMACSLNVSPRSYYDYKRNKHTARSDKKEFLLTKIQEFYFKVRILAKVPPVLVMLTPFPGVLDQRA